MDKLIGTQDNLAHSDSDEEPADSSPRLDRRGLLRFGGAAAAVGATAAIMGQSAVGAASATGTMRFGAKNAAGLASTGLTSSNAQASFHITNSGLGDAIVGDVTNAHGSGCGVVGTGIDGAGVSGMTRGDGPGVRASVEPGARGSALIASTAEPDNAVSTIVAMQAGTGPGIYAYVTNAINPNGAVYARTVGTGNAVFASVENTRNIGAAIRATTNGSGPGISGTSAAGVGGKFTGKTAQIQLVPSAATGHPESGSAGQLFVDKANHLWFCRGDTDWQQLA